jgi:putative transcriptional regulator
MGLVINRPTQWTASQALKDASALRKVAVYWGGPVQPDTVFGLVRAAKPPKSTVRVLDDVFLTGTRKALEAAAREDEAGLKERIYLGYTGWAAGQLEGEVLRSGWIVAPADANAVFSKEPEAVWKKVQRLLDGREARTSPVPGLWQDRGL